MAVKYTVEDIESMFPDNILGEITAEALRNFALSVVNGAYSSSDEYAENQISSTSIAGDKLGFSSALNSTKFAVGAPYSNNNRGAVYIYDADGTNEIKIEASDGVDTDLFGSAIALNETHIVIGASNTDYTGTTFVGAVYIYNLDGTGEIRIDADNQGVSNTFFGSAVDISDTHVAIGCYGLAAGFVYTAKLDGTELTGMSGFDAESGNGFGISVAINNTRVFGGTGSGSSNRGFVYSFNYDGTDEIKIMADNNATGDHFGGDIAVNEKYLIAGASGKDSAYIMDTDGTNQIEISEVDAIGDYFGDAVAISDNRILIGAFTNDEMDSNAGAVYTYRLDGSDKVKLMASDGVIDDKLGYFLTINISNEQIITGVPYSDINGIDSGRVYIFDIPESVQTFDNVYSKIDIADDLFSNFSFAEDGSIIAPNLSNELITTPTSLVTKDYSDTNISNLVTNLESAPSIDGTFNLRISNPGLEDNVSFGNQLATYGDLILASAEGENTSQGAVYIYDPIGTIQKTITSETPKNYGNFGSAISINKNYIFIGEHEGDYEARNKSGRGYLYNHSGDFIKEITPSYVGDSYHFGNNSDMNDNHLIVGAYASGMAFIYDGDGNLRDYIDKSGEDYFGYSVGISNTVIVVGAYFGSDVYVFDTVTLAPLFELTLPDIEAADYFGHAVACSDTRIVVGASGDDGPDNLYEGSVSIYDISGNLIQKIVSPIEIITGAFGGDVAIEGDRIVVGAPSTNGAVLEVGAVFIYDLDGNYISTIQAQEINQMEYSGFGNGLALSQDRYLIDAEGDDDYNGAFYIYDRASGTTVYNSSHIDGVGLDGLIQTNGANDMDSGYVPVNNLSVVTKEYLTSAEFGNSLPTVDPAVVGEPWNNAGVLTISAG